MANPTITVEIAFTTDPFDDDPVWANVSNDVIAYSFKRGRQHELDRFEAGEATVLLNNADGNYWPDNAGGTYSPDVDIVKRIRIRTTYNSITYPRFDGYIEKFTPEWISDVGGLAPIMRLDCADALSFFSRVYLNNAGYAQELSGTRIGNVLDDIGVPDNERQEYYITGDDGNATIYGVNWSMQSFTAVISETTASIKLKMLRVGSPGTLTVSIKATDGNGLPTGGDLCSGTINANTFTTDAAGDWYEITWGTAYALTSNTKYAIVCRATAGDGSNYVNWRYDGSSPSYTGGAYGTSTDSGSSWSGDATKDTMFAIYCTARTVDTGQWTLIATGANSNVNAQEHIQDVCISELGLCYIGADGQVVFEDRSHRTKAPHNTSQSTFTNTFADIELALDDPLLFNEIRATRSGGAEQTASNTTSQTAYGTRTLVRGSLLLTTDAMASIYANYLVARYATPYMRAKSLMIKPGKTPATFYPLTFGYDISTRITVALTQGSINTQYFIEGIEEDWDARTMEWITRWLLSDATGYLYAPDAITETLRPNADGTEILNIDRVPGTGEDYYEDVDEVYVSEADYLYATQNGYVNFELPSSSYGAGTINWVRVYARTKAIGNVNSQSGEFVYISGSWYPDPGVGGNYHTLTLAYANYYREWATNPATGVAWTWSDITSLKAGWRAAPQLADSVYMCQFWVTVNFTPGW